MRVQFCFHNLDSELSKHIWQLKLNGTEFNLKWSIAAYATPYRCGTRRCDLCLTEKYIIARATQNSLLNKRTELISKCRHFKELKVTRFRYTWVIPVGGSFAVKLRAVCLLFWWKWVPSWVFFKYFTYFIVFYCVNGCFGATNPGSCLIILSAIFILILHGRKLFWRALFAVGFLINN